MPANAAVQPMSAANGAPAASPVIRYAAIVSAVIASDTGAARRAPAELVTTMPTATAGLSDDRPARQPPAAPITVSAEIHTHGRPVENCQAIQLTAAAASAAARPASPAPWP